MLRLRLAVEWSWQDLMWKTSSAQLFAWINCLLPTKNSWSSQKKWAVLRIMNWSFWKQAGWVSRSTVCARCRLAVTAMWKSKMGTWSTSSQHRLLPKKLWWLVWKTWSTKQVALSNWSRQACAYPVTEMHGTCSWWLTFFVLDISSRSKGNTVNWMPMHE